MCLSVDVLDSIENIEKPPETLIQRKHFEYPAPKRTLRQLTLICDDKRRRMKKAILRAIQLAYSSRIERNLSMLNVDLYRVLFRTLCAPLPSTLQRRSLSLWAASNCSRVIIA